MNLLLHHSIKLKIRKMEIKELENTKIYIAAESFDYIPSAVLIKKVIKKNMVNVSPLSIYIKEVLAVKITLCHTFVQTIEGEVKTIIDYIITILRKGEAIVIAANTKNKIIANQRFKMLSSAIKSGYGNLIWQKIN